MTVAKSVAQDLIQKSFSLKSINPLLSKKIIAFNDAWELFVGLSRKEKEKILYDHGAGYEFKGKGETFDEKENFHLKQNDYKRLTKLSSNLDQNGRQRLGKYLLLGQDTAKIYRDLMYEIKEEIQALISVNGCDLEAEIPYSCEQWVQRSLFYHHGQDKFEMIASEHTDKGFITFASFSSTGGLQLFNYETREWEFIQIPYGKILIMPGLQMQMLTGSQVKAVWHRVRNSATAITEGRYAQVAFCDLDGQIKYNKEKHGPTQAKEFGFNFCSNEEFMPQVI